MLRVRPNIAGLLSRTRANRRLGPAGRKRALAFLVTPVVRTVLATCPRDTQRYAYGWARAANSAGLGPFPEPEIRNSRFRDQMFTRLEWEEARFEKLARRAADVLKYWNDLLEKRYIRAGRTSGYWFRWTLTRRDRAARTLERLTERLEQVRGDLKTLSGRTGVLTIFRKGSKSGMGRTVTIRATVYGGSAQWLDLGDRTVLRLHNKEPHATIVERRSKSLRAAQAAMRAAGIIPARRVYLAAIDRVKRY